MDAHHPPDLGRLLGTARPVRRQGGARCRKAIELDHDQLRLLDIPAELPSALVRGRAGSGKTVVARELCARRARTGATCLYLCFTHALGRAVDRVLEPLRADGLQVRVAPIRRYAGELLGCRPRNSRLRASRFGTPCCFGRPRKPCRSPRRDPIWSLSTRGKIEENDWLLVSELASGKDLWVFYDDAQQFWSERSIPPAIRAMAGAPLVLTRQHRNPPAIDDFAAHDAAPDKPTMAREAPAAYRRSRRTSALQAIQTGDEQIIPRVEKELDRLRSQGASHATSPS